MPDVPPPSSGLGSNSNYFLNDNGGQLIGVATSIGISNEIIASDGFGFQLNAFSPDSEACVIQQYVIVVDAGGQMSCIVNNWQSVSTYLINNWVPLYKLPSGTLPAGYQCRIALQNDRASNITAATYTVFLNSALDGYETTYNNQQHVNYIGTDGHVHELVYKDSWGHTDLTQAAGAPAAAPGSALDGYETTYNNQQHVNYIGTDGHVHELVYQNHWGHTDLTQAAGAPNAAPGSALDGYETSFNNQQHVNYIGTDGHVHELVYQDHWGHTDLANLVLASVTQTVSVSPTDLSPIVAFELDIVGYDNGQSTTLSSGSGTITYTATNAMTVANEEPSYCEFVGGTAETANTAYGELPTGSSPTFVQSFSTSSTTIKAFKRNRLIKFKPSTVAAPS